MVEALRFRAGGLTLSLDATRQEAARVAACVELRDIRMFSLEAQLTNLPEAEPGRLSYALNTDLQVQHNSDAAILLVRGSYALAIRSVASGDEPADSESDSGDEEPSEESEVASLSFDLHALFVVDREPAGDIFSESELEAFGQSTGRFALYPYARELIADITGRMGLPSLHVGVMRLSLDSRHG